MNYVNKSIHDGGRVRIQWHGHELLVEELPRKPCQKQLRRFSIETYYAVYSLHLDEFLIDNILLDAQLSSLDGFDRIAEKLKSARDEAVRRVAARHGVGSDKARAAATFGCPQTQLDSVHYLKVVPEGVEPIEVAGVDFTFKASWTQFQIYSPSSDLQQACPYYSYYESKSPAAARKLYQLVQSSPEALNGLSYGALREFFEAHKIAIETHHSQWT